MTDEQRAALVAELKAKFSELPKVTGIHEVSYSTASADWITDPQEAERFATIFRLAEELTAALDSLQPAGEERERVASSLESMASVKRKSDQHLSADTLDKAAALLRTPAQADPQKSNESALRAALEKMVALFPMHPGEVDEEDGGKIGFLPHVGEIYDEAVKALAEPVTAPAAPVRIDPEKPETWPPVDTEVIGHRANGTRTFLTLDESAKNYRWWSNWANSGLNLIAWEPAPPLPEWKEGQG